MCWKMCPLLDMFRKQCLKLTPEYNSVDEQLLSFKGTHSQLGQYVMGKPHPRGFKFGDTGLPLILLSMKVALEKRKASLIHVLQGASTTLGHYL